MTMSQPDSTQETLGGVGLVVIGRNEGERLRVCLRAVIAYVECCIYVDSGSTDGSPALARSLGVTVLELNEAQPSPTLFEGHHHPGSDPTALTFLGSLWKHLPNHCF